jgi:hypothetical protein
MNSQEVGVDVKHRLPNSGIFEIAVNASLAFIEGAKPRAGFLIHGELLKLGFEIAESTVSNN